MKLIMLTSDDCDICDEAVEQFKKDFWRELDTGEAKIVNLDEDEEAQEMFLENDLPLAPIVLLMTEKNRLISHIETKDLLLGLKEALPVSPEDSPVAAKQP